MSEITDSLTRNLAALISLQVCAKHAHWNVRGPSFIGVHGLFDRIASDAAGWADTVAEHLAYFGEEAAGTTRTAAKSYLGPYSVAIAKEPEHLKAILEFLKEVDGELKKAIAVCIDAKDQVTADVFIEIGRGVAKDIYLVNSHLE